MDIKDIIFMVFKMFLILRVRIMEFMNLRKALGDMLRNYWGLLN